MKLLLSIFVVLLILLFFFSNVTLNDIEARCIKKLIVSAAASAFLSLIIGIPVLGLMSLF